MKLYEPATTITDYILAFELILLGSLLYFARLPYASVQLWAASYFCLAAAAIAGGTFHGFRPVLSEGARNVLWKITAFGIAVTPGMMAAAGILSATSGVAQITLLCVVAAVVLAVLWRLAKQQEQKVQLPYALMLLIALFVLLGAVLAHQMLTRGPQIGKWILAGSVASAGAGVVQQANLGLHKQFNHNDVAHVLFMVAVYFLYRAGLLLK